VTEEEEGDSNEGFGNIKCKERYGFTKRNDAKKGILIPI
jgi:hypothetical protein